MKNIVRTLVNSNIFIGIAALMAVFQFYVLTGGHLWLGFLEIVVFSGTVLIYNFHRFLSLPSKSLEQNSEMHHWMLRNKKWLVFLLVFLGLHAAVAFFLLNEKIQWTLAFLVPVAVFYAVPFISWNGRKIRIRDFGLFKPFILGLTWATVTVLLPFFNSEQFLSTQTLALIFAERFLFISAICIPFDIRDLKQDTNMLQRSLPNRIGVSKSVFLTKVMLLLYLTVCFFHYSQMHERHFFTLAAFLSVGFVFFLLRKKLNTSSEYFFTFYLDGSIILQSLLIYAAAYFNYRLL
ncbi:MAG: hypothetical protein WD334_01145 [Chitinophagales bacterium]